LEGWSLAAVEGGRRPAACGTKDPAPLLSQVCVFQNPINYFGYASAYQQSIYTRKRSTKTIRSQVISKESYRDENLRVFGLERIESLYIVV